MKESLPDIAVLIRQDEGQYFDRKSLWDGPPAQKKQRKRALVRDEIVKYVAAFANADGGILVCGVENDGTPTGHGYPDEAIGDFLAAPSRRLNPPQKAGHRFPLGEVELLVFEVESAPTAVMMTGNGFPFRVHDQVVHLGESEIQSRKQKGLLESAEAQWASRVKLADLDPALIQRAQGGAGLTSLTGEEYLVRRRLAEYQGLNLILREAAVLLFARNPHAIPNPHADVRLFKVQGAERRVGARHNVQELPRIEGNLPGLIEKTYLVLTELIPKSEKLHNLFFREVPEYPTFAWQEAVVNAVAHRDYGVATRGIEIWLFSDRLEMRNPGALLEEVPLNALTSRRPVHASRNPRIARVLTELGFMREQGEGIPRMIEAMEEHWLRPPEFSSENRGFTVTLRNAPVFDAGDPQWAAQVQAMPINIRQKRALIGATAGTFTNGDYQTLNQVDRDLAYREIRQLQETGFVEPIGGRGRGASYRVIQERGKEALLRQRMETNGRIANADYQNIFGVNASQARHALRKLCEQQILRSSGKGRGAHYLRGPKWIEFGRFQRPEHEK